MVFLPGLTYMILLDSLGIDMIACYSMYMLGMDRDR